jgi:dolichol-phosphate mannosyltransferase
MSEPVVADIVIPVFNEGRNICRVLESLKAVEVPVRVFICYDFEEDDTLDALVGYDASPLELALVRNRGRGALDAVLTGLARSRAPFVITYPADDDYSGPRVNKLIRLAQEGHDIVSASRFMPGGSMEGCPLLKAVLARGASAFMYGVVGLPTRDATNGLRLFSRRVVDWIPVESTQGFAYSLELLVKVHRLGWPVAETPFHWYEREAGGSRFRLLAWLPDYFRWVRFGLATTLLGFGPDSVSLRGGVAPTGDEERRS